MESRIVPARLYEKPIEANRWSTRTLAGHLGMGATTIRRFWQSNGLKPHLKPHLSRSFKLSRDSCFVDKCWTS